MKYLLKHYFNPDFNHLDIKIQAQGDERVDHLNRDYVHNVVAGEVIAELVQVDEHKASGDDSRYLLDEPIFPAGANTRVEPQNPRLLLAGINGYVYVDPDGRICVKGLLNVRRNVDYATGNISFLGDVVVHGSVRSGFKVKGRNILVKGTVEAAILEASHSIRVDAGVKGGQRAELHAKGSIKVKFCENALFSAGKNVLVEGSCLHCRLVVGNALAVQDKLIGGTVDCRRMVRAGTQLGGGMNTITTINLGYDPFLIQKISDLESRIIALKTRREARNRSTSPTLQQPGQSQLFEDLDHELSVLEQQRLVWTEQIAASDLASCVVIVPGELRPGVEVSIGQFFLPVADFHSNVRIILRDEQIAMESPAETL